MEMRLKMDVIRQIRVLQAVSVSQQSKVVDFTSTSGCGFLCEMSIAEVCVRTKKTPRSFVRCAFVMFAHVSVLAEDFNEYKLV